MSYTVAIFIPIPRQAGLLGGNDMLDARKGQSKSEKGGPRDQGDFLNIKKKKKGGGGI